MPSTVMLWTKLSADTKDKQDNVAPSLKLSLQKYMTSLRTQVDHCEISISQMTMHHFPFT
jgi:hypothetical protein